MKTVVIETQYLPPLSYFTLMQDCDRVVVEKSENFVKQSYRNRCYINTAQGRDMLVVPVQASNHMPITAVKIDYGQKWVTRHWRAIQSAYGKSPFFEHYAHDLETVLSRNHVFLYDLNADLLSMCLKWLRWKIIVSHTETYEKKIKEGQIDLRNVLNAKNKSENLKYYRPVIYSQVFGSTFVPDLSLLDLIFCKGPDANLILHSMRYNE